MNDAPDPSLAQAMRLCQARPEFMASMRQLLQQAQCQMDASGLTCLGGGCCCRFDLAGHALYVSVGELAIIASGKPPCPANLHLRRCPFQVGPRCLARDDRPLGCRTFFCRDAAHIGNDCYEQVHAMIQQLHKSHGLPYHYVNMIDGLLTLC